MAKIIDLDIELPVIVEQIRPNTVTIGTPVVTYTSSNIIEVETTFSSDVDYVGGISINETDVTYIDNPQYMSKMFTGLTPATKYTFNGVGLPVMGEKTYGPLIEAWTAASPIPPEYQLVEYLESTGTQWLSYFYVGSGYSGVKIVCGKTANTPNDTVIIGRNNPNAPMVLYFNTRLWSIYKSGVGTSGNGIDADDDLHTFEINYKNNGESRIDGILEYTTTFKTQSTAVGLFCRYMQNAFDYQRPSKIHSAFFSSGETEEAKWYSVYRKADGKPGMYDIINNRFHTNQGTDEFIVGPDKEWEE